MKTIFTKRNLFLFLYILAFFALITWFVPYQKQFYLEDELKHLTNSWFWFIFGGIFLILAIFLGFVLRKSKDFEKNDRWKLFGTFLIWVFAFNLGFNNIIFCVFLGINRIGTGKEVRYTFRVIEDDLAILVNDNMVQRNRCEVLRRDDLKQMNIKLDETKSKKGNVIVVKFIEGNFGFLYF